MKKEEIKKPDTRQFFAEKDIDKPTVGLWDVWERTPSSKRHVCVAFSGVLAKRIANALNIYVPKKKRRKKAAHA